MQAYLYNGHKLAEHVYTCISIVTKNLCQLSPTAHFLEKLKIGADV